MLLLFHVACSSLPPPPTLPPEGAIYGVSPNGAWKLGPTGRTPLEWEVTEGDDYNFSVDPQVWAVDDTLAYCGTPFRDEGAGWDCWLIDLASGEGEAQGIAFPPGRAGHYRHSFWVGPTGAWVAWAPDGGAHYALGLRKKVRSVEWGVPSVRAARLDPARRVFWLVDEEGAIWMQGGSEQPRERARLTAASSLDSVVLASDGSMLAFPSEEGVYLVPRKGKPRLVWPRGKGVQGHDEHQALLDLSPSGEHLLVASTRFHPCKPTAWFSPAPGCNPVWSLAVVEVASGEITELTVGKHGRFGPL